MPLQKKDGMAGGGASGKADHRQNGNRSSGFRTDAAISNNRFGHERVLQPWVPDPNDALNGTLESTAGSEKWDQFAANEKLFGLKTDYNENIYTTSINRNHPQYHERVAAADKKVREIERSAPTTAHVAEERIMDFAGGAGDNEEDKYSGVRRQDFPSLPTRENRYTPPAKRAPTGQSTVKGAPVDPAIISSQIKAPAKKLPGPASEDSKTPASALHKNGIGAKGDVQKNPADAKSIAEGPNEPRQPTQTAKLKAPESKVAEKSNTPLRNPPTTSRNMSPQVNEGAPSAASTVELDVLKEFKTFATQQRLNAEKVRAVKARADKEVKLTELKKFADTFKLSTPVPTDLVSIIAKDPAKQKEIQAKAIKNAEEMAKAKADASTKEKSPVAAKDSQTKPSEQGATTPASAPAPSNDARPNRAPGHQGGPQSGGPNRHQGGRQYGNQQYHGQYRNNRGGPQHMGPQQQTGGLGQRLRMVEQQKFSQPPPVHQPHMAPPEMRVPPTGPANNVEQSYNRRPSGVPAHLGAKLNPTSHEFRPSPFAMSFNPNGHPSAGSSPRSSINPIVETPAAPTMPLGQLVRRKTKSIDVKKCYILSHIQTITPPQGRNWEENSGLRPSYDTLPTWRQLQDEEKPDSNMHLTYKEFFERQPFGGPALATPNPPHVMPSIPHQYQLPLHLQHGTQHLGTRQSPHIPPTQLHTPQHGPVPHPPYGGNDDHRMMHSNSAQSFASPRLGNVPVAYNSPAQMQYNQPVFMGPGTPHMGYRSFSNNPQYMPQQGQMGGSMMMQPQFMPGPQGMVPGPGMMYPGGHPPFIPPSGPQPVPGANGYPSPGRPAAPMMVHQGSQQGQPIYGMSPNVQYNQPVFPPGQQGGPMSNVRGGYGSPGPQHFGTSPQQGHQYGPQHRNNNNNYNKGYSGHGPQHQTPQPNHAVPTASQGRTTEGSDEAK